MLRYTLYLIAFAVFVLAFLILVRPFVDTWDECQQLGVQAGVDPC